MAMCLVAGPVGRTSWTISPRNNVEKAEQVIIFCQLDFSAIISINRSTRKEHQEGLQAG
jgi:hypothetical protein